MVTMDPSTMAEQLAMLDFVHSARTICRERWLPRENEADHSRLFEALELKLDDVPDQHVSDANINSFA